jgi:hypothetical protein
LVQSAAKAVLAVAAPFWLWLLRKVDQRDGLAGVDQG